MCQLFRRTVVYGTCEHHVSGGLHSPEVLAITRTLLSLTRCVIPGLLIPAWPSPLTLTESLSIISYVMGASTISYPSAIHYFFFTLPHLGFCLSIVKTVLHTHMHGRWSKLSASGASPRLSSLPCTLVRSLSVDITAHPQSLPMFHAGAGASGIHGVAFLYSWCQSSSDIFSMPFIVLVKYVVQFFL